MQISFEIQKQRYIYSAFGHLKKQRQRTFLIKRDWNEKKKTTWNISPPMYGGCLCRFIPKIIIVKRVYSSHYLSLAPITCNIFSILMKSQLLQPIQELHMDVWTERMLSDHFHKDPRPPRGQK